MRIVEAHVRRSVMRNGLLCAEVEAVTDDKAVPAVLAYVDLTRNSGYELQAVIRNDANTETDWFDNNMHQAFEDITVTAFQRVNQESESGTRELFKEQILASEKVRQELVKLQEQMKLK